MMITSVKEARKKGKYFKIYSLPDAAMAHFQAQGLKSAQRQVFIKKSRSPFGRTNSDVKFERGTTLDALERSHSKKRWLIKNKFRVLKNLAQAIAEHNIQRGVFHNDLHEKNILITKKGDVKFIDYGLAASFPSNEDTLRRRLAEYDSSYLSTEVARDMEIYHDYSFAKHFTVNNFINRKLSKKNQKNQKKTLQDFFEREYLRQVNKLIQPAEKGKKIFLKEK